MEFESGDSEYRRKRYARDHGDYPPSAQYQLGITGYPDDSVFGTV